MGIRQNSLLQTAAVLAAVMFWVWTPACVDAQTGDDGIHFATQTVVEANSSGTVSGKETAVRPVRQSPLEDMAFISSNKVIINGLGLIIHNRQNQNVSVAIHDSKGRRVLARRFGSESPVINIKTNGMEAGAYIYSVMIGDSLFTRTFFVVHR